MELNVLDEAAVGAAEKALRLASGYLGAKAGELAARAARRYARRCRRPVRAAAFGLLSLAIIYGLWTAFSDRQKR